jgi:predicted alpha/beta superfamily hydrolase
MSILSLKSFLVTAILLFIFSNNVLSQKQAPKIRMTEPDHTIISKIMEKEYQLYISFPKSYSTNDTISYPVLYVLDGHYSYPFFKGVQNLMNPSEALEEVIIVGIREGLDFESWLINRSYYFTPSRDTLWERDREIRYDLPKGSLTTGGAQEFLESVKTEIVPFIDKNYKTNNDRGITGWAFGGLFTAYCFINSDGYFTRFGINTPTLWWNNNEILNQAVLRFSENETWDIPPTKVFISVGTIDKPSMTPAMLTFCTQLENSAYKNINIEQHIFDKETHVTTLPASTSRTLSVLYGKKPQNLTCIDFKTGTFKAEGTNYKLPTTIVSRSEKRQKESADGLETLEASIEWTSECNYELIYLNGSPDMKGQKVSVEILKIEGQKAICTATIEDKPGVVLNFELEKQK